MSLFRKKKGNFGEDLAISYLKKQKYDILERNFRLRNGEIDIIALDKSSKEHVLTFVEVKTRSSDEYGLAREAINTWKLQALQRTALFYKQFHTDLPDLMRIDLVAIQLDADKGNSTIEHIKNIS